MSMRKVDAERNQSKVTYLSREQVTRKIRVSQSRKEPTNRIDCSRQMVVRHVNLLNTKTISLVNILQVATHRIYNGNCTCQGIVAQGYLKSTACSRIVVRLVREKESAEAIV
jgi:hypothetical protein